jgi:hypothetical protein
MGSKRSTVLPNLAHVRDDDDDFINVLVRATNDEEVEAIAMTYQRRGARPSGVAWPAARVTGHLVLQGSTANEVLDWANG